MMVSRLVGWLSVLSLVVTGFGFLPAVAATLTVYPDGSGDYPTIQDAVDAAAAGDTVFLKAGVYETGGKLDTLSEPMSNRVFIAKKLSLVGEDREKTIIKGAHASSPADSYGLGLGPDAVRCIGIKASDVVISNLTVTGGATHVPVANDNSDGNGGGIYSPDGYTGIQVVDCIISNNIAQRAAGIRYNSDSPGRFPRCLVVRCWLDGNKVANRDPVGRGCLFAHCLITRHFYTASLFYAAALVNCTVADGNCRCGGETANFMAYNTLFADNWYKGDNSGCYYNCAFSMVQMGFTDSVTKVDCQAGTDEKGVGFDHFIAPPLQDYRLHSQAISAIGKGAVTYLDQIPEGFRCTDFYGHAFATNGAIAIGCSQTPVSPVGGKVQFAGFDSYAGSAGGYGYTSNPTNDYCFGESAQVLVQMKALGYFYADVWPKTVKLRVDLHDLRWPGLFGFAATGADTVWRHAYLDGSYEFCAPRDPQAVLTLTPKKATTVLYVKQDSTVSPADGSESAPYTDLQTAINALPGSSAYSIVYVKGGTFATGSTASDNLANRIVVPNGKYVHLIGVGGPSKNVIVGARDTTASAVAGMGANAVRALRLSGDSVVQGFTLTGGASHFSASDSIARRGAGVWLGKGAQALDCVISNNVGRQGAAINADESGQVSTAYAFRCLVADNASYNADGVVGGSGYVRSTTTASCLFHNNRGQLSGAYESIAGYFNTVGDFGTGINVMHGVATFSDCIVFAPTNSVNGATALGGVWNFGGGSVSAAKSSGYTTAPALLACPKEGDYRLATLSPAATAGCLAGTNVHVFLTRDVFGKPFRFVDGKPVCGAVQDFAPTVVSNGGGISPSGTNVVRTASVTYTATTAETRPFLGFEVNGTTQEVSGATYEYTLPSLTDWQGVVLSVRAIYDTNWYVDPTGDDTARGTAAQPKKTLKGGLTNAIAGDTVHVAAGTYDTLTMQQTKQLGNNSGSYDHAARAVVPEGVALVGAGAETTFIVGANDSGDPDGTSATKGCGPTAVRCVALGANARLSGFTLTGGRTDADGNADNFHGGGVLASYRQDTLPQITDCIISNCVGRRGGGAMFGSYNRCRFFDNAVINSGNGSAIRGNGAETCALRNSIIDRCAGWATVYMVSSVESCTMGADNSNNGSLDGINVFVDCQSVANTLILGKKSAGGNIDFSSCAYGPETKAYLQAAAAKTSENTITFTDCVDAVSLDALRVEPLTYMPVVDANVAVDAADASRYAWGDADCLGKKRFVNGEKLDIGAVEADWLDAYSKAIGHRVRVTSADGAVERIGGKVTIPPGATLAATVGRGGADSDYLLGTTVAGTCAIQKDGESWKDLGAGTAETRLTAVDDRAELVFAAGGAGATVVDYLRSACGLMLLVR